MNIAKNLAVSIHYTLKNGDGKTLDSSSGQDPLTYLHGNGNLISGLEKELEGKVAGDKITAVIPPEEAYGQREDQLIQQVEKSQFSEQEQVVVGAQFQVQTQAGAMIATIAAVDGDQVTVDMNHPLAGETLHFDVEVVEIREASEDELSHGHIHGEGCNHDH